MFLSIFLCFLLFVCPILVYAQDETGALKVAVRRAREATVKCENDLASLWSQAETLNKTHQDTLQELETMKRDYEKMKKQIEEIETTGKAQEEKKQ